MTSLRDTSADAAAELQRSMSPRRAAEILAAEAALAGPVTLTGRQVATLLDVLRRTFRRLQQHEADKRRPWREREGIRNDRITIAAAIAHLEAASASGRARGAPPEPGSGEPATRSGSSPAPDCRHDWGAEPPPALGAERACVRCGETQVMLLIGGDLEWAPHPDAAAEGGP